MIELVYRGEVIFASETVLLSLSFYHGHQQRYGVDNATYKVKAGPLHKRASIHKIVEPGAGLC